MRSILIISILLISLPCLSTDNCSNVPAPTTLAWNGLSRTPGMGYNTWYDQWKSPTESHVKAVSDFLVSSGLHAAGYTRVEISEGWPAATRDGSGNIQPDATKFPSGLAATVAYIHANGQTAGIYTSGYTTTCGGFIGSGTHEYADSATFAGWGMDYVEVDSCSISSLYTSCWATSSRQVWQLFAQAIRASGRDMVAMMGSNQPIAGAGAFGGYDMDTDIQWGDSVGYNEVFADTANMLYDNGGGGFSYLTDFWIPMATGFYKYERPGYLPHCDYLVGQTEDSHFPTFTEAQSTMQFGLYALWGCPLLLGMDPSTLSGTMLNVYKNADIIAVDQDPLAHAAILYSQFPCGTKSCQVWVKPLSGGNWAIGLLNLDSSSHTIAVNLSPFGGNPSVRDLWAGSNLGTMTSYSTSVAATSIAVIKATPAAGAVHGITNIQLQKMAIH